MAPTGAHLWARRMGRTALATGLAEAWRLTDMGLTVRLAIVQQ